MFKCEITDYKTWPSMQLKVQGRILYYIGMAVFKNSSSTTEMQ
jgi:hypothetical protein